MTEKSSHAARSHRPVMVGEVLEYLAPGPGNRVLDGTVGAGGHAESILESLGPDGFLLGVDRDREILDEARERLERFSGRVRLEKGNFAELGEIEPFDRILLDLGASSLQLDRAERGFSFREDGPLDMRMDRDEATTAFDLVDRLGAAELADLIYRWGEERGSRRIARFIVERRQREPIRSTADLARIVSRALGRRGRIHPATRTFQALRIGVNRELENLEAFLARAPSLLRPGGRIAVISFHSLEDRAVKQAFRTWKREGWGEILTPKPIRAAEDEKKENPRARSARLRAARKHNGNNVPGE
ncbi:MAG TPA: 16S rRNA (cytosine(1402)-N(4))-methyltransferase RsmH [bacterium]|nr:16S rRNA (cytosine(1402)-N(4))-methyltransferase RsmH [bacterium]HPJ71196.1 16S rRNA (cytosine(1402)-N(4))-methyltransferase RsmH [bacterium]HPQ66959.1 16S rRNA (cytosine(1402)-N(4))-methyltransferase RsmH [bacterium]